MVILSDRCPALSEGRLKRMKPFWHAPTKNTKMSLSKPAEASLFRERATPLLLTLSNVSSGINKVKVLHSVFIWRGGKLYFWMRNVDIKCQKLNRLGITVQTLHLWENVSVEYRVRNNQVSQVTHWPLYFKIFIFYISSFNSKFYDIILKFMCGFGFSFTIRYQVSLSQKWVKSNMPRLNILYLMDFIRVIIVYHVLVMMITILIDIVSNRLCVEWAGADWRAKSAMDFFGPHRPPLICIFSV